MFSCFATSFVNRPIGDVVKEADIIVRGRAGDGYADWDKGGRKQIYTYTNFTVTEVLKGKIKEGKILLRQPGGSKDGMEMSVPGVASFNTGEDVVVLLGNKNEEDASYDVPGFTTGKYNVVEGENGEPKLVNSLGGGAVYDARKDARTLSYNSSIPLEVFRRLAKGEDIPEATHRQFEQSHKPAPSTAYEGGHSHARPKAELQATPHPEASASPQKVEKSEKSNLWVPLSFIVLAVFGVGLFMLLTRGDKGNT